MAFVKFGLLVEAERHILLSKLMSVAKEADDLAVLGICGHPIPESRREDWRACFVDNMDPLTHGAIWFWHRSDLLMYGNFPICLFRVCAWVFWFDSCFFIKLHYYYFLLKIIWA